MESKSHIDISGKRPESLVRILEYVLQEEGFLLATMREYRWNITGPNFYSLRRLFDEQGHQLDHWLERLVERTNSIGSGKEVPPQKMPSASAPTSIGGLPPRSMIGDLLGRHERIARHLRDHIQRFGDPATSDLLLRLLEFHETTAWMLKIVHSGAELDPSSI